MSEELAARRGAGRKMDEDHEDEPAEEDSLQRAPTPGPAGGTPAAEGGAPDSPTAAPPPAGGGGDDEVLRDRLSHLVQRLERAEAERSAAPEAAPEEGSPAAPAASTTPPPPTRSGRALAPPRGAFASRAPSPDQPLWPGQLRSRIAEREAAEPPASPAQAGTAPAEAPEDVLATPVPAPEDVLAPPAPAGPEDVLAPPAPAPVPAVEDALAPPEPALVPQPVPAVEDTVAPPAEPDDLPPVEDVLALSAHLDEVEDVLATQPPRSTAWNWGRAPAPPRESTAWEWGVSRTPPREAPRLSEPPIVHEDDVAAGPEDTTGFEVAETEPDAEYVADEPEEDDVDRFATAPRAPTVTLVDHLLALEFSVYQDVPRETEWRDEEVGAPIGLESVEAWEEEPGEPAPEWAHEQSEPAPEWAEHRDPVEEETTEPSSPGWAGGVPFAAASRAASSDAFEDEAQPEYLAAAPEPAEVEEDVQPEYLAAAPEPAEVEEEHAASEPVAEVGPPAPPASPPSEAPAEPPAPAWSATDGPPPTPAAPAVARSTPAVFPWRETARDRPDPYDVAAAVARAAAESEPPADAPPRSSALSEHVATESAPQEAEEATPSEAVQALEDPVEDELDLPPWEPLPPLPPHDDEFFVRRGRRSRG